MDSTLQYRTNRILSIDVLRGAVMLIMALDHVRDFTHVTAMTADPTDLSTTSPVLFFTRWITHFCAPIFVFLSGMSAYISGQRKTKKELSAFLIKRGFWLILVEIFIITLAITFNPLYNVLILQVIWAIGWSMVILGLLVRGSYNLVLITGIIIFFGHNILDYVHLPARGAGSVVLNIVMTSPGTVYFYQADRAVMVAYAILPWTGIMLLGYAFGKIYANNTDSRKRRKTALISGVLLIALFILLRVVNEYGDPRQWSEQKDPIFTLLSFVNVTKYPVSLQYACMTIGTALIFLWLLDQAGGRLASFLTVYGRVPFFYYVLHFFLVHILCVILFFASGHDPSQAVDLNSPFLFRPVNFGFGLPVVYLVWLVVILSLYYPCRWYMRYKQTHDQWWLSYL